MQFLNPYWMEHDLRPCEHQVAGHLFEEGKAGSLVDNHGRFYKPLQVGPRGKRERTFYESLDACIRADSGSDCSGAVSQQTDERCGDSASCSSSDQHSDAGNWRPQDQLFTSRNAPLLNVVPRFFGVRQLEERTLLILEDVAARYSKPSICDIKVGYRTWYPGADQRYIDKCQVKDRETTQSALGFKVCGMQVYRHCQNGYWRCSKRFCKHMPEGAVDKALWRFAHNEGGLRPVDVFGGQGGAIAQLQSLLDWFERQQEFMFYSASVLIIYEGDAEVQEDADVTVRLVDFAHTFPSPNGERDSNFAAGLTSLIKRLSGVMRLDFATD